jgi:iron complex outermembrane recepter protein
MNSHFIRTMRKKSSIALLGWVAAMFVALPPLPLHGQSVDYGALEQLFKEPVTTSVTGSPQRVSDVPATMIIITAEDIRRSGAKDIPGVLRHVGGVDTLDWGNDNIDVSVRGYDQAFASRLLVLVDGRQVYADDFGYTPWNTIPIELSAIRQIEIVKGPSSALFGFNAVGGVINIVTYDPLYDLVNTVSATGGTQNLVSNSAIVTRKLGDMVAVRASAGGSTDGDFSTPIPPAEFLSPRRRQDRVAIDIRSVIRLNDKMHLDLEASHSVAQQNEMIPGFQLLNGRYGTSSVMGKFIAEGGFGLLQATAYTNWLRSTATNALVGNNISPANRVTVVEVHDIFKLGANNILRGAAEYRHNTVDSTPLGGASVFYNNFAFGGMWDWKITPTLSLTNAVRVDHILYGRHGYLPPDYPFSNSDWHGIPNEYSYNSGLVWRPTAADAFRLMAGRGIQLPNLIESGALLFVSPSLNFTGVPGLEPTDVNSYEIGWDHTALVSQILFRVSAFHQHNYDMIAISGGLIPTRSGLYLVPVNIGSSDANGIEIGIHSPVHQQYRWSVDYRPEEIQDCFEERTSNFLDSEYDDTTPRHQIKGNFGWNNPKWELDSFFRFESNNHGLEASATGTNLVQIPAYLSVDGRVAYKLSNRFTWSVAGQNLTHASQVQTSGPAVERRVLGTISFNF